MASDPRAMAAVNEAWFVLRDPIRRAAYDAEVGVSDPVPDADQTSPADTAAYATSATIMRLRSLMIVSMVLAVVAASAFMLIALAQSG